MPAEANVLFAEEFPRSNAYDPDWVMNNQMGPNALWLIEWLCKRLELTPGMRVLDLGCGKALTSIFMAREFGVRVWAADLWVGPDENWERVRSAQVADLVCPAKTEAHSLPFAEGFFDAVVSVDAYQYFGTDELYLGYISRFVRPGGAIAIVVPGWMQPFGSEPPRHLTEKQANGVPFWEDEAICFHTVDWWRALWERSNRVEIQVADTMPDGWKYWRDFEVVLERAGKNMFPSVAEALTKDRGEYLGFVRLVGIRDKEAASVNLYDPGLMALMEKEGN
ncbi:SAM-dependent methyltransferase [Thermodesulfobacteriota bacterium]